jgi:hypothetical protein
MPFEVSISGTQINFSGSETSGTLSLKINAVADVNSGLVLNFTEVMTDTVEGELFTRVHSTRRGIVNMVYNFGSAVIGAKSLFYKLKNRELLRLFQARSLE